MMMVELTQQATMDTGSLSSQKIFWDHDNERDRTQGKLLTVLHLQ